MSRSYLLYVQANCNGTYEDRIWAFFTGWCGHSQIFKIHLDEDEFYGYFEMGCSSGIQPGETMQSLRDQLKEKVYLKDIHMMCWDMHQDKAICIDEEDEEEDNGKKYSDRT